MHYVEFRELREKMHLSQAELAELLGYQPNRIHQYEHGAAIPKSVVLAMHALADEKAPKLIFFGTDEIARMVTAEFLTARDDWESYKVEGTLIILYIQNGVRAPVRYAALTVVNEDPNDPKSKKIIEPLPGRRKSPQEEFPNIDPTTWKL